MDNNNTGTADQSGEGKEDNCEGTIKIKPTVNQKDICINLQEMPSAAGLTNQGMTENDEHEDIPTQTATTQVLRRNVNKFMNFVRKSEIRSVALELQKNPELAMYTNMEGVSALSLAVKGGTNLIDTFLDKITDKAKLAFWIDHALLYGIKDDNYEVVEHLLEKSRQAGVRLRGKARCSLMEKEGYKIRTDDFEDAEFPVYLTPVVLAANLQRGEILKLLISRNASEIHPLTETCVFEKQNEDGSSSRCEICQRKRLLNRKRPVNELRRLVEIYKALSSPIFILYSQVKDPILEAFYLSRDVHNLAIQEPTFREEYDSIDRKCKQFACNMLDLCRDEEELKMIFNATEPREGGSTLYENVPFSRILTADRLGQKEFISHSSCQQIIEQHWYNGLPRWCSETNKHYFFLLLYAMLWCVVWPFACILCMLRVFPCLTRMMRRPINKFICDTIGFIAFLVLLGIECTNNKYDQTAKDRFSIIEWLIIIWIVGMLAREIKLTYKRRTPCQVFVSLEAASREFWGRFDISLISSFAVWMILHAVGIIVAYARGEEDEERFVWVQSNLILVAEGFFSLGIVLASIKLVGLLKVSSSLGPLLISLELMLNDVLRFLLIFFILMFGFALGIANIYSHYKGHVQIDNGENITQSDDLTNFRRTFNTLFWALFGYGEPTVTEVVVGNTFNVQEASQNTTEQMNTTHIPSPEVVTHDVTQFYGSFLFGSYHIVVVVVLTNMLIAMMARSYDVIQSSADTEWKYHKTRQLRMPYFTFVGSLPPPFNIMLIANIIDCLTRICKRNGSTCCNEDSKRHRSTPAERYSNLMEKLGKRYLNKMSRDQV